MGSGRFEGTVTIPIHIRLVIVTIIVVCVYAPLVRAIWRIARGAEEKP